MRLILLCFISLLAVSAASQSILENKSYKTVYTEDFTDNRLKWSSEKDDDTDYSVKDGKYKFVNLRKSHGTTKRFNDYLRGDYMISVRAEHVSGVQDHGYGLIFGGALASGCFEFKISADGEFLIHYFRPLTNDFRTLVKWTTSKAINKGVGSKNELSAVRTGDKFQLYINGVLVHTLTDCEQLEPALGFRVEGHQSVSFDNLVIRMKK